MTFDLKAEREAAQAKLKQAILDAATKLLLENGPDGLSARRLAKEVGASTKVIYSHFGGMQGIVSAIYADAFQRLTDALNEADSITERPPSRLAAVALSYRQFALSLPDIFDLMFGPSAKWLNTVEDGPPPSAAPLNIVTKIILSGQVTHHFRPGDPTELAHEFWAAMHGPVALENTYWPDPMSERTCRRVVDVAIAGLSRT